MRIALLAHCHHPVAEPYAGGLEMHTALVADELVARGHDVTLFAKAGSRTRARLHRVIGRPFVFPTRPGSKELAAAHQRLDRAMLDAVDAIDPHHFDAVLNNSLSPAPYEGLDRLPMLTVLHTPATLERVDRVLAAPEWRPGPRHAWAAVSEATRADWDRLLPEVGCIPNGVDLARWAPPAGWTPEPDLAVWAARITPEKGLPAAIRATRAAGMRLEFSGPISDQVHFDTEVLPLLGSDVHYAGHLSHRELSAFIRRGSVFVSSPQWPEPFGLALVEAMACGTPAAALPRGAAPEVVDRAGGVLADRCTEPSLTRAIRAAVRLDRTEVRQSVLRFDKATMIDRYEQTLTRLVEGRTDVVEVELAAAS